ncbi:MAG TPA: hypothetical protein VJ892_04645 [Candidatus Absconditabacterales bacterium]|nr:hypothetical protein [Candidatus Absconditabacterales bacterium]
MEHNDKKIVFKMFVYLKHIIEGKSSVPFDKDTTNREAYKCPNGYESYKDQYDREEFEKMENDISSIFLSQKEIENRKVRVYHSKVKMANAIAQFALGMNNNVSGGQISVSKKIFNALFGQKNKDGEFEEGFVKRSLKNLDKDIDILFTEPSYWDIEVPSSWENNIGRKIIIEEKRIIFSKGNDSFSILVWYYPDLSCVSFFEGTLEAIDKNGKKNLDKDLFEQIDKVFRYDVPYIPIFDWFCELNEDELAKLELEKGKINWKQNIKQVGLYIGLVFFIYRKI